MEEQKSYNALRVCGALWLAMLQPLRTRQGLFTATSVSAAGRYEALNIAALVVQFAGRLVSVHIIQRIPGKIYGFDGKERSLGAEVLMA